MIITSTLKSDSVSVEEGIRLAQEQMKADMKAYPEKSGPFSTVGNTGGDNAVYGAACKGKEGDKTVLVTKAYKHPCHAYMRYCTDAVVVYNQYRHRSCLSSEADKRFFSWITGENSPWRALKNRAVSHSWESSRTDDLDFIFRHGWIWSDLSAPANLQHSFLVASRMPAEWPELIERWNTWVQEGISEAVAFLFLVLFLPVQFDTNQYKISHTVKYDWPLDINTAGEEYARNFIHGRVENLTHPFSENPLYIPVNRIFGDHSKSSQDMTTYPNLLFSMYADKKEVTACKGFWKKSPNEDFSTFSHRTHWVVSNEELLDMMRKEMERLS